MGSYRKFIFKVNTSPEMSFFVFSNSLQTFSEFVDIRVHALSQDAVVIAGQLNGTLKRFNEKVY